MQLLLVAAIAVALMSGSAQAEDKVRAFIDGDGLLALCDLDAGGEWCRGYVAGIADAMALGETHRGNFAGWRACLPPSVTATQIRDVAMRFLREHQELRHNIASSLVARAFAEAFPCPPKSSASNDGRG